MSKGLTEDRRRPVPGNSGSLGCPVQPLWPRAQAMSPDSRAVPERHAAEQVSSPEGWQAEALQKK